MIVEAKVPAKVTLFGEHAVVYGSRALAVAINRYIVARVEERSEEGVEIVATRVGVPVSLIKDARNEFLALGDPKVARSALRYILASMGLIERELGAKLDRIRIVVDSDLPVGAGMGTSAAVSAATIAALTKYLGYSLSREELARLAHQVEILVQGAASPMDTGTVCMGGVVLITPGSDKKVKRVCDGLPGKVIIGLEPKKATTAELVRAVKSMRNKMKDIVDKLFATIDEIVEHGLQAIINRDVDALGELMYLNHWILAALGVTSPRHDEAVRMLRNSGVAGAKMSGAGSGGALVVLARNDKEKEVAKKILEGLRLDVLSVEVEPSGVQVKSIG